MQKVSNLLCLHNSEYAFDVRLLDNHDSELPMEVTEGKVNIMMPVGSVPDSASLPPRNLRELHRKLWTTLQNGPVFVSN